MVIIEIVGRETNQAQKHNEDTTGKKKKSKIEKNLSFVDLVF